jgi:hypothetical protein
MDHSVYDADIKGSVFIVLARATTSVHVSVIIFPSVNAELKKIFTRSFIMILSL